MYNQKLPVYGSVLLASIMMLFLPAAALSALGGGERQADYQLELGQLVPELIEGLESHEINAPEARAAYSELRGQYGVSYTDTAGVLESIFDRLAESELSGAEAREYFSLLQDGRLMQYRSVRHRQDSLSILLEIIDTTASLDPGQPVNRSDADQLRQILDNLYSLLGLELDKHYYDIRGLIHDLEQNNISITDFRGEISSIQQEIESDITSGVNSRPSGATAEPTASPGASASGNDKDNEADHSDTGSQGDEDPPGTEDD